MFTLNELFLALLSLFNWPIFNYGGEGGESNWVIKYCNYFIVKHLF